MNTQTEYAFSITRDLCQHLITNSREDTKNGNARYLNGGYKEHFLKEMQKQEQLKLDLHISNGVIYPGVRRSNVAFLTIHGHCKQCVHKNKYKIFIQHNPLQSSDPFNIAVVRVTHSHQHLHTVNPSSSQDSSSQDSSNENGSSQRSNNENSNSQQSSPIRNKSSQAKSSQAKSGQAKPSQDSTANWRRANQSNKSTFSTNFLSRSNTNVK